VSGRNAEEALKEPPWEEGGGTVSIRTVGSLIEVRMTSVSGRWHAARYSAAEVREMIIGLDQALGELPRGSR
jgi:hypothetical protein